MLHAKQREEPCQETEAVRDDVGDDVAVGYGLPTIEALAQCQARPPGCRGGATLDWPRAKD
jgi:hypothetical protein